MIRRCLLISLGCLSAQLVGAAFHLTSSQNAERLAMARAINHSSPAYRAVALQRMLAEANFAADRLALPTRYPMQATDLKQAFPGVPWVRVLYRTDGFPDTIYGSQIFDAAIPREQRLRAVRLGIGGYLQSTNFEFGFERGTLVHVMRLSEPNVEYYAHDLDKLIGKPSLIDTNGAHQLAARWLAAMDVDMTAVGKLKFTVNQLHYMPRGATNSATLPLYYVDFGSKHYAASGNLKAFDEPLISVEVLGTTKQLQDMLIRDTSLSCRPQMLITNAFDLINTSPGGMRPRDH